MGLGKLSNEEKSVVMAFVRQGFSGCETGRKIGRSEVIITWVAKATLALGTTVTPCLLVTHKSLDQEKEGVAT